MKKYLSYQHPQRVYRDIRLANFRFWRQETVAYLSKTTNGMAIGLFGTLIIGVILEQIAKICGNFAPLLQLAGFVQGLMGAGIGLGVALALKKDGIQLVTLTVAGQVANYAYNFANGSLSAIKDPLVCYLAVVLVAFALQFIMRRKTPVDLLIIPLIGLAIAFGYSMLLGNYLHYITIGIGKVIEAATRLMPIPMAVIVSALMGMALTAPISSVAIAVMLDLGAIPVAAGAALIGCSVQMVGFAVQAARDNKIGKVISIGIGTSMLEFKNIIRKPIIWLPTIIVSAVLGPIAYFAHFQVTSVGAGMGTSGLVGFIQAFEKMGYTPGNFFLLLGVLILVPAVLVFGVDAAFRHFGLIKKGDLALD